MEVKLFISLVCVCAASASDSSRSSASLALSSGVCQYGWTQDCCFGWTRDWTGQCRPVCESGCKHGECVGPDQCRCHPGFTGKTCNQDVNECAFRPCKFRCMNTPGSYKCYCLNGFMLTADGACRNTRTCAMANCQYGCAVMKGEVRCQCPSPGLRLAPDGRTCVDVDECVTGQASCPRFRKCVNTFGSYICRCHEGFHLQHFNGKYHCTDKKLSVCYDKPGHKKCKCIPSANGKGYDCKTVVKVTIEPAKPLKVTDSPTTISMTTTPIATTRETTPIATTTEATMTTTPIATTRETTMATTPIATTRETTPIATTTEATMTTTPIATSSETPMATTPIATPTTSIPMSTAATTVAPTTVTMTTTAFTTPAVFTASWSPAPTSTSPAPTTPETLPTTTRATTAAPEQNTSTEASFTTTLDNHIHRENTARPRGDVHIPRYENNLFEWDIELGNIDEYTRDDPAAGAVSCSFDEGLCEWMTESEGDLKWELKDDPAGGRYLSVPEATSRRSVKGARLTLPLATPTKTWEGGDLCLSFRHRLHGHHIGSLQVFVRKGRSHTPSIWTRTGGHGWRHTQITLWGRGLVDIVLKAERRRRRPGEIAVDDLSLRQGGCEEGHNRTE